jgi:hypothetical protein
MTSERIRAIVALALPPVAWFVFEQGLGFTLRGTCAAAGVPAGPIWGLCSIGACGAAALLARPIVRRGDRSNGFIARLALLASGLFGIAIAFQTLATLIVPPCAR